MTRIQVAGMIGPICVSSDDGNTLNRAIRPLLDGGESVLLDFAGVKTLASVFLNTALGALYADYDHTRLDSGVACEGLSAANESVVRLVRRNAVKFYSARQPEQDALLAVNCGE